MAVYQLACQCVGWDLWCVGPICWKGLVRTLLWWSAMTTSKNITRSTEKMKMRKIQVTTSKKQVNKGPKWLFKGFKGHSSKIQVLKVLKVMLLPLYMPMETGGINIYTDWNLVMHGCLHWENLCIISAMYDISFSSPRLQDHHPWIPLLSSEENACYFWSSPLCAICQLTSVIIAYSSPAIPVPHTNQYSPRCIFVRSLVNFLHLSSSVSFPFDFSSG